MVCQQEGPAEGLLLKRGRVRLARLTPSGKRLELAILEPGIFFRLLDRAALSGLLEG